MICSNCGTENETGFKFCVKCGSNMENPTEVNYEAVDRGNYHTEEEFSENSGGFTINEGTFIIRDVAPVSKKKSMYTSDELNSSEEEFDFSMYDEPTVPPKPTQQPIQQPQPVLPQGGGQPANLYMQQPVMNGQPQIAVYDQNGMPLYGQPMMYAQPQIVGYDQNGMPLYGQPMMYAQPQIVGYDQNGMPLYGQPMMYAQPQIVGYDQNGMPLYGQPMMYAQPQIVGYDQNGMPLYGQPQMQQMGGIPAQGMVQNVPQAAPQQNMQTAEKAAPQAAEPEKDEKQSFWDFFDDGSKETHSKENENDFFVKAEPEPIIPEDPFADIDNRRKKRLQEKMKANGVMSDIPVVDGDKLEKNETAKMNHIYMRKINDTMSADLKNTSGKHQEGIMAETKEVDASLLSENISIKSRISMGDTESVNADNIEKAVQEHHEALMAQADRAVEALPKKVNPYENELDKIELPDYMQAKKTVREKTAEIPSLPEI
ncbi:MAG: hypothetical protein J6A57_03860 [Ruminococcus sp.]|nr:hypothetical protein [Ruminococcus sp.]